jgi:hypothetical protein
MAIACKRQFGLYSCTNNLNKPQFSFMVPNMDAIETIERKFQTLAPHFDEAALRTWAALEARGLGRGGVQAVARITGMSRTTIYAGLAELKAANGVGSAR